MPLKTIQCCSIFCITLLNSAAVGAQCPLGPMAELLSRSSSEVVFSGVVANLDRTTVAETITFNVELGVEGFRSHANNYCASRSNFWWATHRTNPIRTQESVRCRRLSPDRRRTA